MNPSLAIATVLFWITMLAMNNDDNPHETTRHFVARATVLFVIALAVAGLTLSAFAWDGTWEAHM